MKLRILLFLLLLTLVVGCSVNVDSSDDSLEEDRKLLENEVNKYLNQTSNEEIEDSYVDDFNSGSSGSNIDTAQYTEGDSSDLDSDSSNDEQETTSKPRVDIVLRDVDVDFPNNFDIDDDEVEFEPEIDTYGLKDGEFFIVDVIIRKASRERGGCQFIYTVGGDSDDHKCEIGDLDAVGKYDYDVYVDLKDKFNETDEDNNRIYDEFELDED